MANILERLVIDDSTIDALVGVGGKEGAILEMTEMCNRWVAGYVEHYMALETHDEPKPFDDPLTEICRNFPVQHTPHEYAARIRNGLAKHGGRIVFD